MVVEIVVGGAVAGVLLALGVDVTPSLSRVMLLIVVVSALSAAWFHIVGCLIDRWMPAFRDHPDLSEMRAIPELASTHLESEILDADCGYHFHLGSRASEQAWAASPLEWDFSYPEEWLAKLAPQLLNEAGVAHTCEERGNIVRVLIPRTRDSGFDVTVEAATFGVLVRTGTLFHAHFPFAGDDSYQGDNEREEFREPVDQDASSKPAEQALGLVRDLLSPAVRIRERRAAGIAYHAALEVRVHGQWRRRRAVTLYRYPYCGRREERLWANTHLRGRAIAFTR